jgi:hypothetical protein
MRGLSTLQKSAHCCAGTSSFYFVFDVTYECCRYAQPRHVFNYLQVAVAHSTSYSINVYYLRMLQAGKTVENRRKLSKTVENCRKPSKTVENCRKLSKTVEDCRKPSKTVKNRRKPSKTVENRRKLSKTVENCRKPSKTVENRRNVLNYFASRSSSFYFVFDITHECCRHRKHSFHALKFR